MQIKVIRSKRKTMALEVGLNDVIVRAPLNTSDAEIYSFVNQHKDWLEKKISKREERLSAGVQRHLTDEDIRLLANEAMEYIPKRAEHFATIIGVDYNGITIRNQKTRWGSCSQKGNLNFNCLLMLMPKNVIDSVVVHELCHRKHMNHSKAFYAEVVRVFPEYYECEKWLKENGPAILARMIEE